VFKKTGSSGTSPNTDNDNNSSIPHLNKRKREAENAEQHTKEAQKKVSTMSDRVGLLNGKIGASKQYQDSGYGVNIGANFWVIFLKGEYFPQKLTPNTSTEPRYKLFPKHVLSYILKRSLGCFVWAVPPLLISLLLYNIALNNNNNINI
jgi:hypothetical protein